MSDHDGHESHDHPPYKKIYVVLVVLFLISVMGPEVADWIKAGNDGTEADIASRARIGMILTLVTAFGIALVKAGLVGGYFMHIKYEPAFVRYMLYGMMAFLLVFFAGVAPDVMNSEGANWKHLEVVPELSAAHGSEHAAEGHAAAGGQGEGAAPVSQH